MGRGLRQTSDRCAVTRRQDGSGATPRAGAHLGVEPVGDRDLLGARREVGTGGEVATAAGEPRGGEELQATVVAVAGVDRPVATRLALGDGVPHGGAGEVDAGAGG